MPSLIFRAIWSVLLFASLLFPTLVSNTAAAQGICDRNSIIRNPLVNFLKLDCEDINNAQLATVGGNFTVPNTNLASLTANDLNGLVNIDVFNLHNNKLTTLVDDLFDKTNPDAINFANNNISVIQQNALLTSSSPNNNVDYDLSNNAITSTTLSSGFLNGLKSQNFPNKSIDLSFNNITTLERASFDIFTTNLNLSNNQIVDFAFDALYDLRLAGIDMVLDLSYNQLSNIAARSLFGESLGQVDLSYNQIHTLAPEAVFSTVDLTSLDLGYNLISDFNASSINQTNNPNVQLDLVLNGNPLVLKANNFAGLDLDNVYLQHANITTIPADTFATATKINRLFLSRNNITTLEAGAFSSASGLEWLFLDSNEITDFAANAFGTISSLQRIYLGSNNLTAVQPNTFSGATSLQYLSLNDNQLIEVPVNMLGNNGSLTHFRLQNNNIANLSGISFSEYTSLAELNLGGNQIPTLTADNFKGMTATRIYLSDNQISSLPLNLLSEHNNPATITEFDFSGNSIGNNGWEITNVSWVEGSNDEFTLQLGHALPMDISINITSGTGDLNETQVTISQGSTSSNSVAWTSDGSGSNASIVHTVPDVEIVVLGGYINIPTQGLAPLNLCDRTAAVQTAILADLSINACAEVTLDNLTQYTADNFDLTNLGLTTVNDFDLDYLFGVAAFDLSDNSLTNIANGTFNLITPSVVVNLANNNISVIEQNALLTSDAPDNNVDYNLSNNAITSTTLNSGFLNGLKSQFFPNKSIDLSFNNITTLERASFDIFTTNLNLSNNQIVDFAFDALYDLRLAGIDMVLDLSYNQLSNIAAQSLFGESLGQVNLSNNQIHTLAPEAVFSTVDLTSLDLGYNLISDFNASSINQTNNPNVQLDLVLDGNPLVLKANNFAGLELDYVYLRNSSLTTIPADTFAGATNINRIFFSGSNITTLETGSFSSVAGLDFLYLDNNQITSIPVDAFGTISSLTRIYLGSNNLTAVLENAFSNLTNLQTLTLNSNQLTAVPVNMLGNNASLTTFRLQDNNIANLAGISFSEYTALTQLDLGANQITTLTADNFKGMTATSIGLYNNQLSSLPLNLLLEHNNPASITDFDLSNNPLGNNGWEITNVDWQENIDGSFNLNLGHSLPADVSISLTSNNGNLDVVQITIPAGSTQSPNVNWTATVAGANTHIQGVNATVNVNILDGYLTIPTLQYNGICNRSSAIQTILLNALASQNCETVTFVDLATFNGVLDWSNLNITELTANDIVGLSNVNNLDLSNNLLHTLANDILLDIELDTISVAHNNISVIQTNALVTSSSPDNNADYNLSNNAITSATLSSGFLTPLKSGGFPNKSIDLSYNNITTLDNSQLDIRLDNLNLSNNQITNLPATVFSNMRQAGHDMVVDLSYNQLTSIAAETILGETFAQVDLSYNQIDTLATDAVIYGEDLTLLDLGYNLISDFNASSIDQNPDELNVQLDLVLDGNPLVLKANNFAGLELNYLYLQNSNLTTIPADTFAGATNINRIFLTGTNLTTLEAGSFSSVAGLDFLFLNNNQITSIPVDAFGTISSLTRIYLGDNNLTAVPENTFSNLTNLEYLVLLSNQLTEVPVNMLGNNASLTTFRLQDNNIANLSGVSFSEYTALTQLDLGANQITTLTADNFKGMTATSIGLYNNQLSSLPLNLLLEHNNPASITDFDVSGNALTNNSWEITNVSWVEGSSGEFTLQLGHALPQDISINITSVTGNLNETQVTITQGSTSSNSVSWTADGSDLDVSILPTVSDIEIVPLDGFINIPTLGLAPLNLCDRTAAVQTAIMDVLNISACAEVTYYDLTQYTADNFDLTNLGLTTVNNFDLDYLLTVGAFDLSNNALTTLENNTFAQTNPSSISLASNNIDSIARTALFTNAVGDNNIDINLANNNISSATLASGFLNQLGDKRFTGGSFDLSNNQITTLNASMFTGFSPRNLALYANQITNFSADTFNAIVSSENIVVNLNDNNITDLQPNTFAGNKWTSISLGGNQIDSLQPNAFNGTEALSTLNLGYNNLVDFNATAVVQGDNPTKIETFNLDGNPLVLKANNFANMRIGTLYLRNTGITTVPTDAFSGTRNLDYIRFEGGVVTSLEANAFNNIPSFDVLFMRDHLLETIPSDAFGSGTSLDKLFMERNQLSSIGTDAFIKLTSLVELYFTDNQFTVIPNNMGALTATRLILSGNQITAIAADSFDGIPNLNRVFLNDNQITSIAAGAFSAVPNLGILSLLDNDLVELQPDAFANLSATSIDLRNNQLTSLPVNLLINHTAPQSITNFAISGNALVNDSWEITNVSWVEGSSGEFSLQLGHALPINITVSLSSTTGTLSPSTITIASGSTSSPAVTWTGDAGETVEITPTQLQFNIPVLNGFVMLQGIGEAPAFVQAVDTQTVVVNKTFTPITLPIATGGAGTLTYTLVETNNAELPTGLLFNASTRLLSGSIATLGNYSLTYSVQDTGVGSTSQDFTLAVVANLQPQLPSDGQQVYEYIQDVEVNITLPESGVANGEIIYSLSDLANLPTGLTFNATERTISGSTSATGTYEFMYIATDSLDNESVSLNITLQIIEQVAPTFDSADLFTEITMRADGDEFALQLPSATGGNGELTYSFTTDGAAGLPAGLIFNAATKMIEGQPTEFGTFNIVVTIDDSDITVINDSDSFSFALTLVASLGFSPELPANFSGQSGQALSILLPEGTGGVSPYIYSLTGTLPAGMSFNNNTRILSGTPTSGGSFDLTYRVTDADDVTFVATTQLLTASEAPEFLADVTEIEAQLGQSINVTLPAVNIDGLVSITYSITGLPAGFSFDATTRQLSGSTTQLGEYIVNYKAVDPINQEASQMITLRIKANSAVLQDIMWRQALAIADQTVNSVKKRFTLVNQHRLPYVESANSIGANFQVSESNWIGLWLNSGSGSLANKDTAYSWDGSTDVTQIGLDFSGKGYLIGFTSEDVSTSSSFTVTGDAFDYTGNLDISGLGLLSFYGGFYQPKYSIWAISSSGSGSAGLSITAEGESSTLSSGVDYSMLAFGGTYKVDEIFDIGFEGISSAALDFSDNTISNISSNSASRNKFFGSIDFGKWTNKSAKPAAKKTRTRSRRTSRGRTTKTTTETVQTASAFKWSPKLALAWRSDSGESSSSSGLETTVSVQLEYSRLNFEFGTRNFSSDDFSESGQWLSFNLVSKGKAGLNFTHRQQFGNIDTSQNAFRSDAALTDIVSDMRQDDTVSSISTIAYGWNIDAGSLQLYSKGESNYADSTATNLFQTKSDISWEHIGLSFDSASSKYSWNADVTGGFMDHINANSSANGSVEDPTTISFKAKIRF